MLELTFWYSFKRSYELTALHISREEKRCLAFKGGNYTGQQQLLFFPCTKSWWKFIWKIVLCWGNCCQFGAFALKFQYCPNQPNLPRQLKTHISFSMFPILDTNLWYLPYFHFIVKDLLLANNEVIFDDWNLIIKLSIKQI